MTNDMQVAQWYHTGLSNKDAKVLLQGIPNTTAYGSLKSWQMLPESARQILRIEYEKLPK